MKRLMLAAMLLGSVAQAQALTKEQAVAKVLKRYEYKDQATTLKAKQKAEREALKNKQKAEREALKAAKGVGR